MRRDKIRQSIFAVVLIPLWVACASDSSQPSVTSGVQQPAFQGQNPSGGPAGTNSINLPSSSEVQSWRTAAQAGKLFCPFNDECNPSVVMVSVITDKGVEGCSGVLISPNEVLTNDHCVDKSISLKGWESRRKNLPCKDFVFTHLSGTDLNNAGPTLGCDSIEVRSGEAGIASVDYAVIKLSTPVSDRMPMRLARRGFSENEKAKIYRVQMTKESNTSGFRGMVGRLDCVTSYRTYLYPAASNSDSTLMTFGDCAIQAGNSGSPVINESGELTAIIQGYLTVRPEHKSDLDQNLLDGNYGEVAIGTQLECMPGVGDRVRNCTPILDLGNVRASDYVASNGRFPPDLLPGTPLNHRWQEIEMQTRETSKKSFFLAPACTNNQSVSGAEISFKKGINRFMQVEWRAVESTQSQIDTFAATNSFTSIRGSGARGAQARLFSNKIGGTLPIPACP